MCAEVPADQKLILSSFNNTSMGWQILINFLGTINICSAFLSVVRCRQMVI
jgi:hypothetical protein